jgi:hypothetical protein
LGRFGEDPTGSTEALLDFPPGERPKDEIGNIKDGRDEDATESHPFKPDGFIQMDRFVLLSI